MNLINACIKGQINDTNCLCLNNRQLCQTDPNIAFQLADLITDGLNMSESFQQKFLYKLNQANKELGREVRNAYKHTVNQERSQGGGFPGARAHPLEKKWLEGSTGLKNDPQGRQVFPLAGTPLGKFLATLLW